jgi:hypothetical protein
MNKINTKRRKIVALFFSLSFFTTIVSGCAPQVVSIRMILNGILIVKNLLDNTQKLSKKTSNSVNVSYQDLGKDLRNKDFSTGVIAKMEERHSNMRRSSDTLALSINQTKEQASKLFSLLETRANQNSTASLKDKMLPDIQKNKKIFEEKIQIVDKALSELNGSIKKYDDILGYMQVGNGINEIGKYIEDVDKVILQANVLNKDVQIAIDEGRATIVHFEANK